MRDYYLQFTDKLSALTALADVDMSDQGEFKTTHQYAVDPVGVIYKPTGVMLSNQNGEQQPEVQSVSGYHFNIRMIDDVLPASLAPFCIIPVNPVRRFG